MALLSSSAFFLIYFPGNVDAGLIEEYDTPTRLLENKSSSFAKLVAEYTVRSHSNLENAGDIWTSKHACCTGQKLQLKILRDNDDN